MLLKLTFIKLKQGDILVCDNASVHIDKAIQDLLDDVIETVGFRIVFLPTYSPEVSIIMNMLFILVLVESVWTGVQCGQKLSKRTCAIRRGTFWECH